MFFPLNLLDDSGGEEEEEEEEEKWIFNKVKSFTMSSCCTAQLCLLTLQPKPYIFKHALKKNPRWP